MKFNLSISRNSKDRVGIRVKCDTSRITFLELDLSLEEYAWITTGLSEVEVSGTTKGLEYVGKEKVVEKRSLVLPEGVYKLNKDEVVKYLEDNCQEEGWLLNTYLGSKDCIVYNGKDNYTVNYSVYKYRELCNSQ